MRKTFVLLLIAFIGALTLSATAAAQDRGCGTNDDRINYNDCGAPVAIYQRGNRILVLAASNDSRPAQLALEAARGGPIPANANTIIVEGANPFSGKPVILSRLTTGEYQLNTSFADGREYIVIWYHGPDLYRIDPLTGERMGGGQPIVLPDAPNPGAGALNAPPAPAASGPAPAAETVQTVESVSIPGASSEINNCRATVTRIVRIRAEPNTTGAVLGRLPFRTTYTVTERVPGWYRVIYLDTQGWVSEDFVTTTGECGR